MKTFITLITCLTLASCASTPLPDNVSVSGRGTKTYLNQINYDYLLPQTADFSNLKLCLAQNIASEDVVLNDSSGSFVGAYTGNYYQTSNSRVVSGQGIFRLIDDTNEAAIVGGTTGYVQGGLIPITKYVKFTLTSTMKSDNLSLVFSNITRAQQYTGSLANNGFTQVGTWSGADPSGVITQLNNVAEQINSCIAR